MIEELLIPESATFYKITHEKDGIYFLPKGTIEHVFGIIGKSKIGQFLTRRSREPEAGTYKPVYYSFCVFKLEATPSSL